MRKTDLDEMDTEFIEMAARFERACESNPGRLSVEKGEGGEEYYVLAHNESDD